MVLAVLATYFAASRPARTISRVPVVAALSGRPPAPKKRGRLVVPIGIGFLVVAFFLLGAAGATTGNPNGGGGQLAAERSPSASSCSPWPSSCCPPRSWAWSPGSAGARPISVRLALRDLSRYRARSGPALAAIALSTLIAVIVCVESAGRFANVLDYAGPNLTSSQLVIYTAAGPTAAAARVRARAASHRRLRSPARRGSPARSPGRWATRT